MFPTVNRNAIHLLGSKDAGKSVLRVFVVLSSVYSGSVRWVGRFLG